MTATNARALGEGGDYVEYLRRLLDRRTKPKGK